MVYMVHLVPSDIETKLKLKSLGTQKRKQEEEEDEKPYGKFIYIHFMTS